MKYDDEKSFLCSKLKIYLIKNSKKKRKIYESNLINNFIF